MKVVCLLSGGIDSPVAAYMMADRGAEVVLLHMDNRPFADDMATEKVVRLRERLESVLGREMRLFVAPHGPNQEIFAKQCSHPYQCILCKRTMLHVAKGLALRLGGEAVVTGESLGQVASQTLHNLRVESHGLDFPVLRPLIGLDKIEIEGLAKRIGTYEISTGVASPCAIVPKHPITMCKLDDLLLQQSKVDFMGMVDSAASQAEEVRYRRTGRN
jgi:tRNA uracil 4-sulfurtransferase